MKRPRYVEQLMSMTDKQCHYPHGDPGTPEFHFCRKKVAPGKPYCHDHCKLCYRQPDEQAGVLAA